MLTEKQKRFADAYIQNPNAAQAAIQAGYSRRTAKEQGSRLLARAGVREYMDRRLEKQEKKEIASQEEVLETLTAIMRQQKKDTVVVKTLEGVEQVEVPNKVSDALKAANALAKTYGLHHASPAGEGAEDGQRAGGTVEIPSVLPGEGAPDA